MNFICEAKSMSKKDILIEKTCSRKVVQRTETTFFKLATFHSSFARYAFLTDLG